MSSQRRFRMTDLFRITPVNLDSLTETYYLPYYAHYLITWPDCFTLVNQTRLSQHATPVDTLSGYNMSKVEGEHSHYHGHVSALSIAPMYRKLGLAKSLMKTFESINDKYYHTYFCDLYVRASNTLAIAMYRALGYVVYRQVLGYYNGEEDAYDMRKSMALDKERRAMIPRQPLQCHPNEADAA